MKNLINRTRDSRDEDEERGREDKIIEDRVGRDERVGQDRVGRDERVGQDRIGRDERVGQEERVGVSDPQQAVRKGVLWQQRDRLFSRWKERYIVLTRDYLHCFKRVTNRSSEMGDFIFKVKLVQLEGVTLIDKRGYLTVCLCILREGRIYLRSAHGIRDWFQAIQSTVYDSKRRRKFWVKDPAIPPGCTPCSLWTEKKEVHEKSGD
ncbi:uncharacterized protein LOC111701003 [Eurytemora carolleeae]|uniref:uncharacterized protein LOC111701003 n=1 Tax=Eurytemora carolleeae TaxID=1294199 RepID=UPI000C78B008|nr:uncharacterized protein LOC111701003 [Eurytemora carolleeae]|eukprot:XP_023327876.1 uncharacterized protein LOC111701003 [Eurytemora affinis]